MSRLDYLLSILFFAGLANVVLWIVRRRKLKQHWRIILAFAAALTLPFGVIEWPALKWGAWSYNPAKTFNLRLLGAELETYLFVLFVAAVIFGATIILATHEDRKRHQ